MTTSTTVTTEAPPATRALWCKVCRRFTAHVYIGTQEFPGKAFHLYNCTHCQDTTTEEAS
jgi:hypothetical protein